MFSRLAERLYAAPTLLLALTMSFWAGNAIAGQLAEGRVSPMVLVFLRWVIVAAVMWALFGAETRRHWETARPKIWSIALTAFIGFSAFNAMFYIASLHTTAVNIGILQGAMPLMVIGLDYLMHGQRLNLAQALGAPIALIGVIVVATKGDIGTAFADGLNLGDGLIIAAGFLYAVYTIRLRTRPAMPGIAFFTLMAPVAAVTSLPMLAAEMAAGAAIWPDLEGWLVTLYVAAFPSCIAQLFFMRAVDLIGPGRVSPYINLVPIFTAIFAVALLGETFQLYHALALGLVIAGIALSQSSLRRPAAR